MSDKTKSVLRRENVFYADDDPVNRVTTYIPWHIAEGTGLLQDEVPHQFGIHGLLEEQGHVMMRLQETPQPELDDGNLAGSIGSRWVDGWVTQTREGRAR